MEYILDLKKLKSLGNTATLFSQFIPNSLTVTEFIYYISLFENKYYTTLSNDIIINWAEILGGINFKNDLIFDLLEHNRVPSLNNYSITVNDNQNK
jgi:hypothetical protein